MATNLTQLKSFGNTSSSASGGTDLAKAAGMYNWATDPTKLQNPYASVKLPTIKQPKAPTQKELKRQQLEQQLAFAGQFSVDAVNNLINDNGFVNGTADQRTKLYETYANTTIPEYLNTHPLTQGDPMFKASVQAQTQQALKEALDNANQGIGGTSILTALKVGANMTKNMFSQLFDYTQAYSNQPENIDKQYKVGLSNLDKQFGDKLRDAKSLVDLASTPFAKQKAQDEYDRLKAQYDQARALLETGTQFNRNNAPKAEAESLASIIHSAIDQSNYQKKMMEEDPNYADIMKQAQVNMNDPNSGFTKNFAGMWGARGLPIAANYAATTLPTMATVVPFAIGGAPGIAVGSGTEVQAEVINQVAQEIAEAPAKDLLTVPEFSEALKKFKDMGVSDPEASARGHLVRQLLQDSNSLTKAFAVGAAFSAVEPAALFAKGSLINRLLTKNIISNNLGGKIARIVGGTTASSLGEGVEEVAGNAVANQAVGKPLTEDWQEQFFPAMVGAGPLATVGGVTNELRGNEPSESASATEPQGPTQPTQPTQPTPTEAETQEQAPTQTISDNPFYNPVGEEDTVVTAGDAAARLRGTLDTAITRLTEDGQPVTINTLTPEEVTSLARDINAIMSSGIQGADTVINGMFDSLTPEKRRLSGKLKAGDVSLTAQGVLDAYASQVAVQQANSAQGTTQVATPSEQVIEPNSPTTEATPPAVQDTATTNVGAQSEVSAQSATDTEGQKSASLQTRGTDRASAASIAQMQSIAANPIPDRLLSDTIEAQSGAPVVTVGKTALTDAQKGNTTTVQSGQKVDGKFVSTPAQWAVVPASSLLTSHNADGVANPSYDSNPDGLTRVVSGNGRSAGLARSYATQRADGYKQALVQKAQQFGIDPNTVSEMSDPVLARVISDKNATDAFVRSANSTQMLGASNYNQAALDASAVNQNGERAVPYGYDTDRGGNPTDDVLIRFMSIAIPANEHLEYVDADGMPNGKLRDRFDAAVFYAAYGDKSMFSSLFESEREGMRKIANALKQAAGCIVALDLAGKYDLRQYIIDAVLRVIDGKSKGMTLAEIASLTDLISENPTYDYSVRAVIKMFRDNIRSSDAMAEYLMRYARRAVSAATYEQEATKGGDLFVGDAPSPQSVFNAVFNVSENIGEQNGRGEQTQGNPPANSGAEGAQQADATAAGQQDTAQSATSSTAVESTGASGSTREVATETTGNVSPAEPTQDTGDRADSRPSDSVTTDGGENTDTGAGGTASQTEQRTGTATGTKGNDVAQEQTAPVISGHLTQEQFSSLDEALSGEEHTAALDRLSADVLTVAKALTKQGDDESSTKAIAAIMLKTVTALARTTNRAVDTVFTELTDCKFFEETRLERLKKGRAGYTYHSTLEEQTYVVISDNGEDYIASVAHEMAHVYAHRFLSWVAQTRGQERTEKQKKAIKDFADVIRSCFNKSYSFLTLEDEELVYQFSRESFYRKDSTAVKPQHSEQLQEFLANAAEVYLTAGDNGQTTANTPFKKLYDQQNSFVRGLVAVLDYLEKVVEWLADKLNLTYEDLGKRVAFNKGKLSNEMENLYARPITNYMVNGIPEAIRTWVKNIYDYVARSTTGNIDTDIIEVDSAVIDKMISKLVDAPELNAQTLKDALVNSIDEIRQELLNITEKQQAPVPQEQATTSVKPKRKKKGKTATKQTPTTEWSLGKDVSWLTSTPVNTEEQRLASMIIRLAGKYESGASHKAIAKKIAEALNNGSEPYHLRSMVQQLSDMFDQTGDAYIYLSELPEVQESTAEVADTQTEPTNETAESNTALVQNLPTLLNNFTEYTSIEQVVSKIDWRILNNSFLADNLPMDFPLLSERFNVAPVESNVGLSDADALSNYVNAALVEELLMAQEMYGDAMSREEMVRVAKDTVRKRITVALGNAVESNEVLLEVQQQIVADTLSERPELLEAIDPANPANPVLTVEAMPDTDAVTIANGGQTVHSIAAERQDRATNDTSEGIVGSTYGDISSEADAELAVTISNDLILELNDGANNARYVNMTDTPAYSKFTATGSDRIVRASELSYDTSTATAIGEIAGRRLSISGMGDFNKVVLGTVGANVKQLESIYKYNPKAMLDTVRYYVSSEIMAYAAAHGSIVWFISRGADKEENGSLNPTGLAASLGKEIRTYNIFERKLAEQSKDETVPIVMLHEIQHSVIKELCSVFSKDYAASLPPAYEKLRTAFVEFAHELGIPSGSEFNMESWNTLDYVESVNSGRIVPNEVSSVAAEYYMAHGAGKKNELSKKVLNFFTTVAGLLPQPTVTNRINKAASFWRGTENAYYTTYGAPRYVFSRDGLTNAISNFMDTVYNQDTVANGLSELITDVDKRSKVNAVMTYLALANQITDSVMRNYAANPNLDITQALAKTTATVKEVIAEVAKNNNLFTTSNDFAVMYRNGGKLSTRPTEGGVNVPTYAKLPENYITITTTTPDYRGIRYKGNGRIANDFLYLDNDVQKHLYALLNDDQNSEQYAEAIKFLRGKGVGAVTVDSYGTTDEVILVDNPSDVSFDLFYHAEESKNANIDYNLVLIDALNNEPVQQQEAIDAATQIVRDIQNKNQEAAQQYIRDYSAAESAFESQGIVAPITPNWWSSLCTNIRDVTVDENAALYSWTSLNLPTEVGGPGTSSMNMEFTIARNRVLAARTELAEQCVAPLNDYLKDVADRLGIDVATVAKDLGTMYTDLHTLEAQRKQEVELEQDILRANLLPTSDARDLALAETQTNLRMFKDRQSGEDNGFKLYGGKPAKDCMEELTNLSQTYESVADEAMVQFRAAFQKVINIMLSRGVLSDEYRQYFGDFMYYMPLYTRTQYEDTKINDVVALFSPKQDRSRKGSTSFALDAYTNLNWLIGRTANNLGSKQLGEEIARSYQTLVDRYNAEAPNGSSKVNAIKFHIGNITITGVNGLYLADADYINAVSIGREVVPEAQQRKAQSIRDHAALMVRRVVPVQVNGQMTSTTKNYYVWFNEHAEDYVDTLYFDKQGRKVSESTYNKLEEPGARIDIVNHVDSNAKVHRALYEPFHLDNEQDTTTQKALNLVKRATSGFGQLFTTYTAFFPIINAERDFVERATFANNKTYRDENGNAIPGTIISARMAKNGMSFANAMRAAYTGKPENIGGIDGQYLTEMKQLGIMSSASISRMLDQNGSKLRAVIEQQLPLMTDATERAALVKQLAGLPKKSLRVWAEMLYAVPAYAMFKSLRESNVAPRDAAYYVTEMMNLNMKSSLGRGLSYIFPFVSSIGNTALQLVNSIGLNLYTFSTSKAKRRENAKNTARTGLLMIVGIAGVTASIPLIAIGLGDGDIDKGYRILDQKPLGAYNYIPIPTGGGNSIKLPLGFGLGPIIAQFAIGMDRIMRNKTTASAMMFDIADSLIRNNSPLTTPNYDTKNVQEWAGKVLYTITPSLLQPFAALSMNKDYWGSPISRTKFTEDAQRASDTGSMTVARGWKAAVKWLYDKTGVDMSPETLRFLTKSYCAGPFSYIASYVDSKNLITDPEHKSVRTRIGPVLSAMGAASFYDNAGNVDQQAYFSATEFYDDLIRQAGVYDIIKGKGVENNGPLHRRNTLLQMGFSPLVANDVALLKAMNSDLNKLYISFKNNINDAYSRNASTEEIKSITAAYYAQRNTYIHNGMTQLNYYNNKIDKEADNLPPQEILDIFRSAYGNN